MYRTILLLMMVCWLGAPVCAQGERKFYGYYDGKQFMFTVTPETLANIPNWEEGQDNPPLPARRALDLAVAYLPKLVSNPEEWTNRGIQIFPVINRKWVYVIEFSDNKPGLHSKFVIVVLMNGVVVEPQIVAVKP